MRPQQLAVLHIHRHHAFLGHRDHHPHAAVLGNQRRTVGGTVGDPRRGPDGFAGLTIQRSGQPLGSAGQAQHDIAVDDQVFRHRPDAVLGVKTFLQVDRPDLLAVAGAECGQSTKRRHVVHQAVAVGRRRARAGLGAGPGLAVGRLPQQLAVQVQRKHVRLEPEIPGTIDPPVGDRNARVPDAALRIFPNQLGSAFGPAFQQAGFRRDVVPSRAVELGPVRTVVRRRGGRGNGSPRRRGSGRRRVASLDASSAGGRNQQESDEQDEQPPIRFHAGTPWRCKAGLAIVLDTTEQRIEIAGM